MLNYFKTKLLLKIYKSLYKPGHYYSPVPDIKEIRTNQSKIFHNPDGLSDINLNVQVQKELLTKFKEYQHDFNFPEGQQSNFRYYLKNNFFIRPDGFALYCMMRHFTTKKIIEIGSGFSSALMLDVNKQFLNNSVEFTFIEPYPERLFSLIDKNISNTNILENKVQDVSIEIFTELQENDILFIDSSHISKVGSDVNYIVFHILPQLKPGVIIHFHDITWPFEYPKDWIYEGRFWNEAYLLYAFLMNNKAYEILLFNNYFATKQAAWLKKNLPLLQGGGGSFYMKKR